MKISIIVADAAPFKKQKASIRIDDPNMHWTYSASSGGPSSNITQHWIRQRKRSFTIISTISVAVFVLLLSACDDGIFNCIRHADAFNTARPFSTQNTAYFRVHATTRSRENVSLTSSSEKSSPPSSSSSASYGSYDRQEFEMQVGRAMNTLRADYPDILKKDPDYSIYSEDLELIDPSGVHLNGVKDYKNGIRLVHALVGIFYCPERSDLTFRMCFDKARQNIRIHWNARIIPKAIFGGTKSTLHVDGISIYEFDRMSGNITQHRLERLIMNDDYVVPEHGIFAALRRHAVQSQSDSIPGLSATHDITIFGGHGPGSHHDDLTFDNIIMNNNNNNNKILNQVVPFKRKAALSWKKQSTLFQCHEDNDRESFFSFSSKMSSFTTASSSLMRLNSLSSSSSHPDKDSLTQPTTSQQHHQHKYQHRVKGQPGGVDQSSSSAVSSEAHISSNSAASLSKKNTRINSGLEKKNFLRKKFGLKPLTMDEFVELEGKVAEMELEQKNKAAAAAIELERVKQQKDNGGGIFAKLFGNVLKDTCETNYDCESPEVCCNFGFKKMCCSSGMRVLDPPPSRYGQLAQVPVPLSNPNPYPPGDARNRDPFY